MAIEMNLFDYLTHNSRSFPEKLAVAHGMAPFASWRELRQRAEKLAAGIGLPPSSRVAIVSKNCPEYIEILFACWAAGLVVVPINAKLHKREVSELLEFSKASMVFVSEEIETCSHWNATVIGSDAYETLLCNEPREPVDRQADDPAWIFFTSGTTGRAKGATLTNRNLTAMVAAHLADFEALDSTDSILHAAPMSHGSGLYILPYVARAAAQIIPRTDSFDPAAILELCDHYQGVGMFLAPTMLQRLRNAAERAGTVPDGLRSIIYGGGPMHLEELKRCKKIFGNTLCQLYGQGEAPMTITGLNHENHLSNDDRILRSAGWPRLGVEIAIWDENDMSVPDGVAGEIVCRGDVVMSGYWEDEKATADTIRSGWLKTGDIGVLSEEGYLTLQDRSKDMIISGGSNIYPREVEEILLQADNVSEVCVLGLPDEEWGEKVAAVVVAAQNTRLDEDALDALCLQSLARFKRPKIYYFWDKLPKNSYGKISKRTVRELLLTA
mgnify:CR=1 FL=1|tara:strand:+ start:143 stop:1633 length:1491 start_codon:yes stop_codon:yes gene_type:complete